jgi:hypothetical protein
VPTEKVDSIEGQLKKDLVLILSIQIRMRLFHGESWYLNALRQASQQSPDYSEINKHDQKKRPIRGESIQSENKTLTEDRGRDVRWRILGETIHMAAIEIFSEWWCPFPQLIITKSWVFEYKWNKVASALEELYFYFLSFTNITTKSKHIICSIEHAQC